MQGPKSAKCEEYVEYANHCLPLASSTADDGSRLLLRQMAAEWLELAEKALDRRATSRGYAQPSGFASHLLKSGLAHAMASAVRSRATFAAE